MNQIHQSHKKIVSSKLHWHCHSRLLYVSWPFEVLNHLLSAVLHNTLQVDYEMALEYATQAGVNEEPREDIFIPPLEAEYECTELFSPIFVFRLVA